MSDVVFASEGQAQVLAAQEAVRRKGMEVAKEFEEGAKAVGKWDAGLKSMQRTSDAALRSVQTEQEKIIGQITAIQESVDKGIYKGREKDAEEAIARLRQKWVDVDAATVSARQKADEYADSQAAVKRSAEQALAGVQTELEKIEQDIKSVETAAAAGLIPPDAAEEGVEKLRKKYDETKKTLEEVNVSTGRLGSVIFKAFDPVQIAKWAASFVGVKALLSGIRAELEDIQTRIDKRVEQFMKPKERAEKFTKDIEQAKSELEQAEKDAAERAADVDRAKGRGAKAGAERQADVRERIGDLEVQLRRAQEDRDEAIERADKSRRESEEKHAQALLDARKQLQRAHEDAANARTPDAKRTVQRRLEDARQRLERVQRDIAHETDDSSLKNIDRRIVDIQRDLERKRYELSKPPSDTGTENAQLALDEARRELAEQRKKLAELEAEQRKFQETPAYQRFQAIEKRDTALDETLTKLTEMAKSGQLSSDELEKFADIMRELGEGVLARKLSAFAKRLDDGTVSVDEIIGELNKAIQRIQDIEKGTVNRYTTTFGGTTTEGQPARPLTTEERAATVYLQQLVSRLEASNREETAARARQIDLLEQMLEQMRTNGGIPVDQ